MIYPAISPWVSPTTSTKLHLCYLFQQSCRNSSQDSFRIFYLSESSPWKSLNKSIMFLSEIAREISSLIFTPYSSKNFFRNRILAGSWDSFTDFHGASFGTLLGVPTLVFPGLTVEHFPKTPLRIPPGICHCISVRNSSWVPFIDFSRESLRDSCQNSFRDIFRHSMGLGNSTVDAFKGYLLELLPGSFTNHSGDSSRNFPKTFPVFQSSLPGFLQIFLPDSAQGFL